MTLAEKWARYRERLHAVQTGVAFELERDAGSGTPKHLRVGVNSAMINDAALVRVLLAKGVLTEDEYVDALLVEVEREVAAYEARLTAQAGRPVTLG